MFLFSKVCFCFVVFFSFFVFLRRMYQLHPKLPTGNQPVCFHDGPMISLLAPVGGASAPSEYTFI